MIAAGTGGEGESAARALAVAGLAAALLGAGCGSDAGFGTVRVSATLSAVGSDRIDRVILSVSEGDPPVQPAIEAALSRGGDATWSAWLHGIPAPGRYAFTLDAFDAAGVRLYSGSVRADVPVGSTTQLAVLAQEVAPGTSLTSSTPVISAVSVSPDPVGPGGQLTVSVQAQSAPGDGLACAWQDGCGGAFLDAGSPSTVWTAPTPAPSIPCQLGVRVTGGSSSATIYFAVRVQ